MAAEQDHDGGRDATRQRNVRRSALVLTFVALAIYVAFIVESVLRSGH